MRSRVQEVAPNIKMFTIITYRIVDSYEYLNVSTKVVVNFTVVFWLLKYKYLFQSKE